MKKIILSNILFFTLLLTQQAFAQDCKTTADLENAPGKFLTAAQSKWPTDYSNLTTTADKAQAKKTLSEIEKAEAKSHEGFNLTGGNWENVYSTKGYEYLANTKLAQYTFQSALYEFFCSNGKSIRNSEYSTVLRIAANALPINTLGKFLGTPYNNSMGDYDFGLQYLDWKNHKSVDVNAQLIPLYTYITCNNASLLDAINTGDKYFQNIPDREVKPNSRSNEIYRYWFIKKNNLPLLMPVSRKEYLQSLLQYYEREKLYFPKLIAQLTSDHDAGVKRYANWEADVNDKIAVVKKALADNKEEWLQAPAIVNHSEDVYQTSKNKLTEKTNYNRFWKFYDNESKGVKLYKYNPDYFKASAQGAAKPQLISVSFRYVSMPASLKMLKNFTEKFDFDGLKKLVE